MRRPSLKLPDTSSVSAVGGRPARRYQGPLDNAIERLADRFAEQRCIRRSVQL